MTSWFWIPIIGIPIIAVITGLIECALNSPGKVRAGGFTGILRDVTKLSLLGSGAVSYTHLTLPTIYSV